MTIHKPSDLTDSQWLLLRHLFQYNRSFYTEFLYQQFSRHQIERKPFYLMFYSLAALSYIQLIGYGKQVPGHLQDFCYVVTRKGRRTVAEFTKAPENTEADWLTNKKQTKGMIAACLARTVRLKDYLLDPYYF